MSKIQTIVRTDAMSSSFKVVIPLDIGLIH